MVCKENVVSWFRNLSSHKRVDVMCTLLNMCLPFEIRYLGTYVEDRGKRDYNDLRDTEHHANSPADLTELSAGGICDTRTRRKLILYLALLNGCNYNCAVIIYKSLANLDVQEMGGGGDEQLLEELLLLYTMALNHPSFSYEQKSTIGNIYLKLQDEEARLNASKGGCGPCILPNERLLEATGEIPANCPMAQAPMQQYPDMQMRSPMIPGVPPGLPLPPPGLCIPPGTEPLGMAGTSPQYLPLGFPSGVSPIGPWQNQTVMMTTQMNPMIYQNELQNYPTSPLLSRQSSPSQSRSPSRSSSPLSRRNNSSTQRWSFDERKDQQNPSTSSTMTNQISTTTSQSIIVTNTGTTSHHLPSRNLQNQRLPTRESSATYTRHNSIDTLNPATPPTTAAADKSTKQPPPPRLRTPVSGDGAKELPNFKGNLQNYSRDEIRRLSDEDLRDIGLTPNAVGQLRNIVRSQTSNGLSLSAQIPDKKPDPAPSHHQPGPPESPEIDLPPVCDPDSTMKPLGLPGPQLPEYYQPLLHHHHHHHHHNNNNNNNHNLSALRRCYPAGIQQIDPNQLPIYTQPPPALYQTQNPCYACLTVPVSGQRYPRCSAQHMYCLAQLQTLRLDENNRNCSQSSSSDSTGSRSPPETPPVAPWITTGVLSSSTSTPTTSTTGTTTGTTTTSSVDQFGQVDHSQMGHQMGPQNLSINERRNRKGHMMRKNQLINGQVNMAGCFQLSGPSVHSQMAFLPHGHVSLRPNTGIYPNFSAYRPNYPGNYQPNGEIMFPYPPPATAGTPPPVTLPTSTVTVVLPSTQGSFMGPAGPFTATVQQAKISCYNCGSSSHLAGECKDQSMEDLTKRASYRLDYSTAKQPGDCPNDK